MKKEEVMKYIVRDAVESGMKNLELFNHIRRYFLSIPEEEIEALTTNEEIDDLIAEATVEWLLQ